MMKWYKVNKAARTQPGAGVYGDWKEQIAEECSFCCVYCAIGEASWGGIDHYQIDHFRPKSKFSHLTHVITNLYYACPVCNRFKSDDWPSDTLELEVVCYPDPSEFDYNDLMSVSSDTFQLDGTCVASKYVISRLYLNRPQLVFERREAQLSKTSQEMIATVQTLLQSVPSGNSLLPELFSVMSDLTMHLLRRSSIRPYQLNEIRRPNG